MKVAVATLGDKGLEDVVSRHFGHTNTFTVIELENDEIKNVEVLQNPALKLQRKRGPAIAGMLAKNGVNAVIASEMGQVPLQPLRRRE